MSTPKPVSPDFAAMAREWLTEQFGSGIVDVAAMTDELVPLLAHASADGFVTGEAAGFTRGRAEGLTEAARVADEYRSKMAEAAAKPHPFTGKENTIAPCKEDAAMSILAGIRALASDPVAGDQVAEEGGWLREQIASARRDIAEWPAWMKRELAAEIGDPAPAPGLAAQEVERLRSIETAARALRDRIPDVLSFHTIVLEPSKQEFRALFAAIAAAEGRDWHNAPCSICGYNGPGYFQPDTHPCAALSAPAPGLTEIERLREALLTCPFCGGEASRSIGSHNNGEPWPYIECTECACSADPDVWNRRAALSTPPAADRGEWQTVPVEPPREMWAAAGDAVVALQHRKLRVRNKQTREEREVYAATCRAGHCTRAKCATARRCADPVRCLVHCHGGRDGECNWALCPQLRDNEPKATGRHCPRDMHDDQEDYYGA